MLSQQDNERLTRVGPGTPMGQLLRRYWMPIGALTEFDKTSVKPIRLLGEDLVLYKDLQGTFGLIDRQCAHRRADLIRDARLNECVSLPIAHRSVFVDGLTFDELLAHPIFSTQLTGYAFQAGQPEEIRRAYEDAMGIATKRHKTLKTIL